MQALFICQAPPGLLHMGGMGMCGEGAGLRYLWFDLFFHRKVRKGRKDLRDATFSG
jgi:hypothetical protein